MSSKKRFYDFGPFRLDPVKRQLLREGEPVRLPSKAFEILLVLIEANGQVLEKSELMERGWPDSFVEEGILAVNISTLRKALGEQRGENRYIATIPGRGYQFVASVREWDEEVIYQEQTLTHVVINPEPEPVPLPTPRLWARPRMLVATGVLLLCVVIGVLIWLAIHPPVGDGRDGPALLEFVPLTEVKVGRESSITDGRLSPDGSLLAYCAVGDGINLWIRQIGGGQPLQITRGPWHDDAPVWSPNGQRIAFMSDRNHQLGIWTIPSLGNTEPTLLKTLELSNESPKGGVGVKHWSKNGEAIYFSWRNNLYKLDVATKEMAQLTNFDPEQLFSREYRISPDEEWVAYVDRIDGQIDLWRAPLRGGEPIRMTNDRLRENRPVWSPDSQRIIYSVRLDGHFSLYQAYVDGRPPEFIIPTKDECYLWDVSPDGRQLLYFGWQDASDLWQINTETKDETRLTEEKSMEFWPQVSPDGQTLVFHALRKENIVWEPKRSSLLVGQVSSPEQAIEVAAKAFDPRWSPDGRQIAYLRETNGLDNLFTVGAAGGEEKQLTTEGLIFSRVALGPPFNLFGTTAVSWSPDSRRIAYCSKKDGAPNLWIVAADGSSETKVSANTDSSVNFSCPIWSPDGKRLACLTNTSEHPPEGKQSWSLWVTDFATSGFIFRTESIMRVLGWTALSNEFAVATVANQGANRAAPAEITVSRITIADHSVQEIARIQSAYFPNFHLSPDGRNIAYVAVDDGKDNIWVLPVNGGESRKLSSNPEAKTYYAGLAWSPDGKRLYYAKQECWNLIMLVDHFR